MIFTQAAIDTKARIIEIVHNPRGRPNQFPSKSLVPALMHACSESRAASAILYKKLPTFGDARSFKDTFVDWEKDIFLFEKIEDLRALANAGNHVIKERGRNLAIMLAHLGPDTERLFWEHLPNVERIYLIRHIFAMGKDKSGLLTLQEIYMPKPMPKPIPYWVEDEAFIGMEKASRFLTNFLALGGTRPLKECRASNAKRDRKSQPKRKGNIQKLKVETEEEKKERKERLYTEDVLLAAKSVDYSNQMEHLLTAVMVGSRTKMV